MDPLTIGLAFGAAQSAVSHIKQAIALGKDINGLVDQFSKFFESSDAIHRERTKVKVKGNQLGKTDAELGKKALQIAMHSDALREAERELKDMIIWNLGKPDVWDQMIKERTRLFKERAEAELAEENKKIARKKDMAERVMFAMYFIGISVFLFCFFMVGVGVYAAVKEQQIHAAKVAERNLILKQQAAARAAQAQKERDNYVRGSN